MAAVPLARADDTLQAAGIRVAGLAFLALVAALVLCRPSLVPVAAIAVGGLYGAELAISGAPLDIVTPAVAAGLFLAVELGYWSIEERGRWLGEAGDALRRSALVAGLAVSALLVSSVLLAFADAVRAGGLALDLLGAAAAAAVIAAVVLASRRQVRYGQ